jgi:hypothetical protein
MAAGPAERTVPFASARQLCSPSPRAPAVTRLRAARLSFLSIANSSPRFAFIVTSADPLRLVKLRTATTVLRETAADAETSMVQPSSRLSYSQVREMRVYP